MDDELLTEEEAAPVASDPAASIDAAQPRTGTIIWYRHNGQEFAVREDTAEHRHLVDSGARRIEGPSAAAERAAPSPTRSARSTKAERAK